VFQVGFLRCHRHDDGDTPVEAGDWGSSVSPNALLKFLHLGDERLHVKFSLIGDNWGYVSLFVNLGLA